MTDFRLAFHADVLLACHAILSNIYGERTRHEALRTSAWEANFKHNLLTDFQSVLVPFESTNEILGCDHSNETSLAVLPHSNIYLVWSSNFWFRGNNLMVHTDPLFSLWRSSSAHIEMKTAGDLLTASARWWGWRKGKKTSVNRLQRHQIMWSFTSDLFGITFDWLNLLSSIL